MTITELFAGLKISKVVFLFYDFIFEGRFYSV